MAFSMPFSFAVWNAQLNNFAVEIIAFTGKEIGFLHAIREIPGFLAFTVVFFLVIVTEQRLALLSLAILGLFVAATPLFPTTYGFYATTFFKSIGFHFFATLQLSLTLQWISKHRSALVMGRLFGAGSCGAVVAFCLVFLGEYLQLGFASVYLVGGLLTFLVSLFGIFAFPALPGTAFQSKKIVLRKNYWLFYALTFMSGARRQIFVVFAGLLMVEKFGYSVGDIALLYLINQIINIWFAPAIGKFIVRFGERRALLFEYTALICIFLSYAAVDHGTLAAFLFILDHLFFALAIAINSYFHKIADQSDIASTAGVSFTINHIAAVVLPFLLGYMWIQAPGGVFVVGAGFALGSLLLSLLVPRTPDKGRETILKAPPQPVVQPVVQPVGQPVGTGSLRESTP